MDEVNPFEEFVEGTIHRNTRRSKLGARNRIDARDWGALRDDAREVFKIGVGWG